MDYGYIRPYFGDEDGARQLGVLQSNGCGKIMIEKHASANNRIELCGLIDELQPGDRLVVCNLFAFADSSRHLAELLFTLEKKGVFFQSLKEKIDTSTPNALSFLETVERLVEFQNEVASERTRQGMKHAEKQGKTAGRPKKPDANVRRALEMYESKSYTLAQIKEATGISKSTLYRYLEN